MPRTDRKELLLVWFAPLLMTMQLMAVAVVIAAVIGIVGAWAGSTLQAGGRGCRMLARVFFGALVIAAAMPMILHATAWEATAGKFGWYMLTQTGAPTDGTGSYGFFTGLIAAGWIHGIVGGSMVAIATWFGVTRVSPQTLMQSRMLFGPTETFFRVALPIAAPWSTVSLVATAALAATEMTVVDLYGYRTIADQFYLDYAVDPNATSILAVLFLPLALCGCGLTWAMVSRRPVIEARARTVEQTAAIGPLGYTGKSLAIVGTLIVAAIVVLVPAVGLLFKAGQDVAVVDGEVALSWSPIICAKRLAETPALFASEYQWTASIAALTATLSIAVAWPLASRGRTTRGFENVADAASIVLLCLPGPIVGLAIVRFFQLPVAGFDMLYQQTLVPTCLALSVRGVPIGYWIMRSAYRGIDSTVLDTGAMQFGGLRRMFTVDGRLLLRPLMAGWIVTAIVSSGDVPAMLPVIPPGVTTVGVRLFGLLHSGARYQEASLAIGYIGGVLVIVCLCFGGNWTRRGRIERYQPKCESHR